MVILSVVYNYKKLHEVLIKLKLLQADIFVCLIGYSSLLLFIQLLLS